MKLKMKLLAAAVALASANSAFAAIGNSTTGNGELFLSVFDSALGISYTRDLGISMDSFLPAAVTGNAGYSQTFAADSLLTGSLGTGGLLSSSAVWNIGAMDSIGTQRYLTTVANGTAATAISGTNNTQLKGYYVTGNGYTGAASALGTHTSQANGSNIATSADGVAYFDGGAWGNNWGGKSAFSNTGTVGQDLDFYLLSTVGTGTTTKILVDQYDNLQGAAKWNLAANGTLTYTAAAPVPEASTWAMFAAGLLVVGGIARRRLSV